MNLCPYDVKLLGNSPSFIANGLLQCPDNSGAMIFVAGQTRIAFTNIANITQCRFVEFEFGDLTAITWVEREGKYVVAAASSRRIFASYKRSYPPQWDISLQDECGPISALCGFGDGRLLVGCEDGSLVHCVVGRPGAQIVGHVTGGVASIVAMDPDHAVIAGGRGSIYTLTVGPLGVLETVGSVVSHLADDEVITCAAVMGERVLLGTSSGVVISFNVGESGVSSVDARRLHQQACMAITCDDTRLTTCGADGVAFCFDRTTIDKPGAEPVTLCSPSAMLTGAALCGPYLTLLPADMRCILVANLD